MKITVTAMAVTLSLAFSNVGHASLITADLSTPNDGLLTIDTNTNLEWLNITRTLGQSYYTVTAGIANETYGTGFRFATPSECNSLFLDAQIKVGYVDYQQNFEPVIALQNLMGYYYQNDFGSYWTKTTQGWLFDPNPTDQLIQAAVFQSWDSGPGAIPPKGGAAFPAGGWAGTNPWDGVPMIGAFLVRELSPVPEPTSLLSTLALVSSGLLLRRRGKAAI